MKLFFGKIFAFAILSVATLFAAFSFQSCAVDGSSSRSVKVGGGTVDSDDGASERENHDESGEEGDEAEIEDDAEPADVEPALNKWTVVVYMSADNSLEPDAIADLNEMESAPLPPGMEVLVLLDRADGYDASNGDWTDTRLFRLERDEHESNLIVSERLSSKELGLSVDTATELDMSNRSTLSALLSFARKNYEAENYALIVWGHGSGWRDGENVSSRAFAMDDGGSSSSYMTISDMRWAVERGMDGKKLDFLGFDTCFGVCLETAYEFRSAACLMAGSPSIESQAGWDYKSFFQYLSDAAPASGSLPASLLCDSAMAQFKEQYRNLANSAFCVLNLGHCADAVSAFDTFASAAAATIETYADRDAVLGIFRNKCVSYRSGTPSDVYVDSLDFVRKLRDEKGDGLIPFYAGIVEADYASFVVDSWNSTEGSCSPGVFFAAEKADGVFMNHPDSYVSGSGNPTAGSFVNSARGYVPSKSKYGSLLDKIFYMTLDN